MFGSKADKAESARIYSHCRDAGIQFFDTANLYNNGESERILSQLVKGHRDEVVIATKVGHRVESIGLPYGLPPESVRRACDGSLERLGVDVIDLYYCHVHDPDTEVEVIVDTINDLIVQGKVRDWAISNWPAERITAAVVYAQSLGKKPPCAVQPLYNLVRREIETDLLPATRDLGLAVFPYNPLAGGLLTGKYSSEQKDDTGRLMTNAVYKTRYGTDHHFAIAGRYLESARQVGVSPATLAVAWVKAQPGISGPIIGASKATQLDETLAAVDFDLSPAQKALLEDATREG